LVSNKNKKYIRHSISGIGGMLFVFSMVIFAGIEFPFFNHWNPLYNPYIFMLVGFLLFIARTFIKDVRGVANFLDFFGPSGLVHDTYQIPFTNITPTRANYIDKDGEKKSIRHRHSFSIPSKDRWVNEWLIPDNGLASLNPVVLVRKYGAMLKDLIVTYTDYPVEEQETKVLDKDGKPTGEVTKTLIEKPPQTITVTKGLLQNILMGLGQWIPEIQALDPMVLHTEQASEDTVDGLNQEGGYQMAEIRKGWFSGGTTTKIVAYIAVGAVVGAMIVLMYAITLHLNFANVG